MKKNLLLKCMIIVGLAVVTVKSEAQTFTDATTTYGLNAITAGRSQTAWADYDNDGKLEFIITGDKTAPYTAIFKQDGSGVYQDVTATAVPGGLSQVWISSVAWADYNRDGYLDFVIIGTKATTTTDAYPGITELYKNNGDGTFTKAGSEIGVTLAPMQAGTVTWADFNNDGNMDLFIQGRNTCSSGSGFPYNNGSTGRFSRIYMNNGNGTFHENVTYTNSVGGNGDYFNANLIDYNNDGYIDIYLFGYYNANIIIRNNGNGTFTNMGAAGIVTTLSSGSSAWGDYNNDSYLDVVQAKGQSWAATAMNFFSGSKAGTFTDLSSTNSFATLDGTARMIFADYNNDGYQDVIVSGLNTFKVMANRGAAKGFAFGDTTTSLGAAFTGVYGGTVQMLDINNDNKLDIYTAGATTSTSNSTGVAKIFLNNSASVNTAPSAPTNLSYVPSTGDSIILKWNPATDAESPRLTYDLRVGTASGGTQIVEPNYNFSTGFRKIPVEGMIRDTSTVAGSQVTYKIKNMPAGTYYWSVQAVDGGLRGGPWATEGTFTITAQQASNIIISNLTSTSATLSWTNGNYANRAVFMKQGLNYGMPDIPDTSITANSAFGTAGSNFRSTGWYCVYSGNGSAANITGLTASTAYTVAVMEYSGTSPAIKYNRGYASDNPKVFGTFFRPTTQASVIISSNTSTSQFTISWTNGNGSTRAAFIMKGSTGTAAPLDKMTYTANTVYKSGSQIGTSGWYCVYNGTGSTVTVTGLDGGYYQAMVCEYAGISGLEQYLTTTAPNNPVGINTDIVKSSQTITFDSIPAKTFGDADFTPVAIASSGLQVTYTVDSAGIATVVNGNIHILSAGTCHVIASQLGDANYEGVLNVSRTLVVNKAPQTITFDALPAKNCQDAPIVLTATATSGLKVFFASSNLSVATVSGDTLFIGAGGTAIISALQSGNINYAAAPNVTQTLTVSKLAQTLTFGALPAMKTGDRDYPLTATSSSGLKVRFTSSDVSVALIEGSMTYDSIHVVGVGTAIINASQGGNDIYASATPVPQSLTVTRGTTDLDALAENGIMFYPNPVTDKLTVSFTKDLSKAVISIFSLTGREIFTKEINSTLSEIGMGNLAPGLYIIKIISPKGVVLKEIVKQ